MKLSKGMSALIGAAVMLCFIWIGFVVMDREVEIDTSWWVGFKSDFDENQEKMRLELEARLIVDIGPQYIFPIHEDDFIWDGKEGNLTSPFGERDPSEIGGLGDYFHEGLDLWGVSHVGTWQARVVSVADGVILNHWINHPVKGRYIEVLHDDGSISEYAHLSKSFIHEKRVVNGKMVPWRVKQGDPLGRIGNTGLSKGYLVYDVHLHFALRRIDPETNKLRYVNPLKYIRVPLPIALDNM